MILYLIDFLTFVHGVKISHVDVKGLTYMSADLNIISKRFGIPKHKSRFGSTGRNQENGSG